MASGLKNSKKGLINIRNNDNKRFLWCHIRHLNLVEKSPQRITKKDKEMINKLDYEGIKFPVSKKDYCKIERQNNICINVFCYESGLTYPINVSNQKFKDYMDLLLISKKNRSHYVYIKDFNTFVCNKTKNETKQYFCNCCLQCFSSEIDLIEHKENCLIINGKQSVKLNSGLISFKNYFKQLSVLFKIYADFECILKRVRVVIKIIPHTQKNMKITFLVVLLTKLFVLIINSVKKLFFTEEKMLFTNLLRQFLVSIIFVRGDKKNILTSILCLQKKKKGFN